MISLQIDNVHKKFGKNHVLKGVSLSLKPGDIYALIGPNGSGKTTLVKIVVGLLNPNSGSVKINEYDIKTEPLSAKANFGYVSDNPEGYGFLNGHEFLALAAGLKGLTPTHAQTQISQLKKLFPIADILRQPMAHYSRGNAQKVAFLASLLGNPQILIIDEPISGLDPASVKIFGEQIKDFAKKGGSVLFVTHTLSFAGRYANRFGLLVNGTLESEAAIKATTNLEHLYHQKTA